MSPRHKKILITVSGEDRPGITANLMKVISDNGVSVTDIGQSVTYDLLSLSILLDGESMDNQSPILKDLLFAAKNMGLALDFKAIDQKNESNLNKKTDRFILSCISSDKIPPVFLHDMANVLAKSKINITRIDSTTPQVLKSLDITTSVPQNTNWQQIKERLLKISDQYRIDMAFLKDSVFRRNKRLIVFDMDSTLIQNEVIDELAEVCGQREHVEKITRQAMEGKIDFDESLKKRVAKLKGLEVDRMQEVLGKLIFTPGTEEFIDTVKSLGYKLALISGGFGFFANHLKEKLQLDYAFANELEIKDQKLTGNVSGEIINPGRKATILNLIAQQEGISLEQVVAIGDGANDLPMLAKAGLGIAFHAKDVVKKEAPLQMGHGPMTSILYFLGIHGPLSKSKN
ncbi:MAG: phosphoserine phosphatase SerB [Halobacteriovoraceae bacterium]|nr:phosphoserine phosphatase SerB [Halobacteriovoraceae bacterium]